MTNYFSTTATDLPLCSKQDEQIVHPLTILFTQNQLNHLILLNGQGVKGTVFVVVLHQLLLPHHLY